MKDQDLYALTAEDVDRIRRLLDRAEGGDYLRPLAQSKHRETPARNDTFQALVTEDITGATVSSPTIGTLFGATNSTATVITTNSLAAFPVGIQFNATLETEQILVVYLDTPNAAMTVVRSVNGVVAGHADLTPIVQPKVTLGSGTVLLTEAIGDTDGTFYADESANREETVYNVTEQTIAADERVNVLREPFSGLLVAIPTPLFAAITSINANTTTAQHVGIDFQGVDFNVNVIGGSTWNSTISYQEGQVVLNSGLSYWAKTPNANQSPASNTTAWRDITNQGRTVINLPDAAANGWAGAAANARGAVSVIDQMFKGKKGNDSAYYCDRVIVGVGIFAARTASASTNPWASDGYDVLGTGNGAGLWMPAGNGTGLHAGFSVDLFAQGANGNFQHDAHFRIDGTGNSGLGHTNSAFMYYASTYANAANTIYTPPFRYQTGYNADNSIAYASGTTSTVNGWVFVGGHHTGGTLSVAANSIVGVIVANQGGTGTNTLTPHGVLIGEGTNAIAATAAMTNGQILVGVTGADPAPVSVSADATLAANGALTLNTVTVSKGGTGATSFTPFAVLCGGTTNTGAIQNVVGTGTNGQVLTAVAGALPVWANAASGNGSGITINTTTITGGAANTVLYDIGGFVGELTSVPVAMGGGGWTSCVIGGLPYSNANNALVFLPAGTAGKVLTMVGGVPAWSDGGNTTGGTSIAVATISSGTLTQQKVTGNIASISRTASGSYTAAFVSNYATANDYAVTAISSISGPDAQFKVSGRNTNDVTVTLQTVPISDDGWVSVTVIS